MNKLLSELHRLYYFADQPKPTRASLAADLTLAPVSRDGRVRTLVVGFKRASAWPQVASLYQAVQQDLALPAPAISVSGEEGYGLWFSLAEPVAVAVAQAFLVALRRQYLADIVAIDLDCQPSATAAAQPTISLPPALCAASGRWSAFIDPSMGSMFLEEAGLEMAPNADKQADMLAGLVSIKAAAFAAAGRRLGQGAPADIPSPAPGAATSGLNLNGHFSDPQAFLLAVMNDPSASTGERIQAAAALLPYFAPAGRK